MKHFIKTKINEFLNENKIYSGQEVWDYFNKLKSRHHSIYDDPIHNDHKEQILNNNYLLKDVLIEDLLKNDIDLVDFVDTQIDFYKEDWDKEDNQVTSYGLIGDNSFSENVLIDGYHRVLQKIINGDKTFKVFVPIGN